MRPTPSGVYIHSFSQSVSRSGMRTEAEPSLAESAASALMASSMPDASTSSSSRLVFSMRSSERAYAASSTCAERP